LIGIIDYGLGNIQSFINSYRKLDIEAMPVRFNSDLKKIDHIILPGVGSFDSAIKLLWESNLVQEIEYLVFNKKIPILGVCVGLQIMTRNSDEGIMKGLGWLDADVKLIKTIKNLPLPHMGWNEISISRENSLLTGLNNSRFYFLHNYYLCMDNVHDQIATTEYGDVITSAISNNNIYGCQFHPEKSHSGGLKILENFAKI